MISLRREVHQSELSATRFAALLKAFKGVTAEVSKAALPASPELAQECKQTLALATGLLDNDAQSTLIEDAGKIAVHQIEQICQSNQTALEERDTAVKDVVTMVAKVIGSLKGNGETHKSNFAKLADELDVLSHVEDATELRRRLHKEVTNLRRSVEEMRRDNEASFRQSESQMSAFRERLERARKDSDTDRLTGLGSRLAASRYLRTIASRDRAICFQLFDIEAFTEINNRHGTLFGDQLLKALAHLLRTKLDGPGGLFRWAADEFLVVAEGSLSSGVAQCAEIRRSFAGGGYLTVKNGVKVTLSADIAYGVTQYIFGEGVEDAYRRARQALERNSQSLRR